MRQITVPAGIGDNIWLAQKLLTTGEKFNFVLPGGQPQRGKQIFDLLPQLANSATYGKEISYQWIKENNLQRKRGQWAKIGEKNFVLSANEWLESRNRIEKFLPDLSTEYFLKYSTSEDDKIMADLILEDAPGIPIGIYTTSYGNAQKGKGWLVDQWVEFVSLMHVNYQEAKFIILGAEYDEDHALLIMQKLYELGICYTNTIGQPLPVVVEILKQLKYFVGFPSGLSILNETLGKDGVMFYTQKDAGIINTWAHPDRIAAGAIKECLFCEPRKIFDWIKNEYKLFNRV